MAQSGHALLHRTCPLLGVKRTLAITSQNVQSSRVTATEIAWIAGAANTTTGNIAIQATSQDNSQWMINAIGEGEGKLAIPAAIKLVGPA